MIVGASFSIFVNLLGFSFTTVSRVYSELCKKLKRKKKKHQSAENAFFRSQLDIRNIQLVQANRKDTVTQIIIL